MPTPSNRPSTRPVGKTKHDGVTALIEFDEKGDLKSGAISLYQYKGWQARLRRNPGRRRRGDRQGRSQRKPWPRSGEAAKAVGEAARESPGGVKAGAEAVKAGAKRPRKASSRAPRPSGAADAAKRRSTRSKPLSRWQERRRKAPFPIAPRPRHGNPPPATHQRSCPGQHLRLVALGYTMVYGIMGLINFAHGEVG